MPVAVPPDARCRSCGYLLRELDRPICPECAREFDPSDPSTYIDDPRRRRRHRIIALVVLLVVVGLLAFALGPRGVFKGQITFTSAATGATVTIRRWELKPPRWIGLRYPGFHWTTRSPAAPDAPAVGDEAWNVVVRFDFASGGRAGASGSSRGGQVLTINGIPAVPETGAGLLKALQAPGNMGVAVSTVSAADLKAAADD